MNQLPDVWGRRVSVSQKARSTKVADDGDDEISFVERLDREQLPVMNLRAVGVESLERHVNGVQVLGRQRKSMGIL